MTTGQVRNAVQQIPEGANTLSVLLFFLTIRLWYIRWSRPAWECQVLPDDELSSAGG